MLASRWRWWVDGLAVGVRGRDVVAIAIRNASVRAMFGVTGPRTMMTAMLHALGGLLRLDVHADTGRTRPFEVWGR